MKNTSTEVHHSNEELVSAIASWFKAVADESRVRILMRLKESECNVNQLVEELGIAQASVSKHLAVLRNARIVEVRRQGTSAFYSIRGDSALKICGLICQTLVEEQNRIAAAMTADAFSTTPSQR